MTAKATQRAFFSILLLIVTLATSITFLTGLYGMNFAYIPELQGQNNYYILLGVMALLAIGMVIFIKRRKWV